MKSVGKLRSIVLLSSTAGDRLLQWLRLLKVQLHDAMLRFSSLLRRGAARRKIIASAARLSGAKQPPTPPAARSAAAAFPARRLALHPFPTLMGSGWSPSSA